MKKVPQPLDQYGISTIQDSKEKDTQAQTSFIGAQQSYITSGTAPGQFVNSLIQNGSVAKPSGTRSPNSRYAHIPTENLKFQKFIELIHKSKMSKEDIKEEIMKYVQALETNYMDTISDLKEQLNKERLKLKRLNFEKIAEITGKNELESLFVECIEEVRKDIMKRRLKNEIFSKKKF